MNADQVREIRNRLPDELTDKIDRLGITFVAQTQVLTQLTAGQVKTGRWTADMIDPAFTEQRVIEIFHTLVEAIERADAKDAA